METVLISNTLIITRTELFVYILLALIVGWALKSIFKGRWKHRPWDLHNKRAHHVSYIPEDHQQYLQ